MVEKDTKIFTDEFATEITRVIDNLYFVETEQLITIVEDVIALYDRLELALDDATVITAMVLEKINKQRINKGDVEE